MLKLYFHLNEDKDLSLTLLRKKKARSWKKGFILGFSILIESNISTANSVKFHHVISNSLVINYDNEGI